MFVNTDRLTIAFDQHGPPDGWPVVLSHGFPYGPAAFDKVVPSLVAAGGRVIVPFLRGFGPTSFRSRETLRSGQQAALGSDLIALLDALGIEKAIVAGFDWGGLASCVAAALWPERIEGLVSLGSYDIIDVERGRHSYPPSLEYVTWYQHLFQTERGRECLEQHRREICRMLWLQWSPGWNFGEKVFDQVAEGFDNPDFVEVVVSAYRFSFGLVPGDPSLTVLEEQLSRRPEIAVPAVTLDGALDPLKPSGTADHARMFAARHEHRTVTAGHALPFEAPDAFADAILTLKTWLPCSA